MFLESTHLQVDHDQHYHHGINHSNTEVQESTHLQVEYGKKHATDDIVHRFAVRSQDAAGDNAFKADMYSIDQRRMFIMLAKHEEHDAARIHCNVIIHSKFP